MICRGRFIRNLSIQLPRTAERIAAGPRAITQAKQRLRAPNTGDHQCEGLERETETQETYINRLVNQLFGTKPLV